LGVFWCPESSLKVTKKAGSCLWSDARVRAQQGWHCVPRKWLSYLNKQNILWLKSIFRSFRGKGQCSFGGEGKGGGGAGDEFGVDLAHAFGRVGHVVVEPPFDEGYGGGDDVVYGDLWRDDAV